MILNALALKLEQQARGHFRDWYFEATLIVIVQAVIWFLRYAFSYCDINEIILGRDMEIDRFNIHNMKRNVNIFYCVVK